MEILEQPEFLAVGKSRYDSEVIEATKRYRDRRKKRARELQFIGTALQAMAMTNTMLCVMDSIDEADDEATDNLYDDASTTM